MPNLSGSELKVLLAIVRKTYGFGKQSDKISFNLLQKLTGLSRDAVNTGIKGLGQLLIITPGVKNVPTLEGVNKYALNLNIKTGELVRKSDWSEKLTSKKSRQKPVRKSDSTKPNTKPTNGAGKKSSRPHPQDTDPRVATLLASFIRKYQERVGVGYAMRRGKDPKLLKDLLTAGQAVEAIEAAMDRYLADPFYGKTGFDIGGFASVYNRLNSAGSKKKHNYEDDPYPSI